MRTALAAIALLLSLACFAIVVLFVVVKALPSYHDGGFVQLLRDLFWQGWAFLTLVSLVGMAFLVAGVSLLPQKPDPRA